MTRIIVPLLMNVAFIFGCQSNSNLEEWKQPVSKGGRATLSSIGNVEDANIALARAGAKVGEDLLIETKTFGIFRSGSTLRIDLPPQEATIIFDPGNPGATTRSNVIDSSPELALFTTHEYYEQMSEILRMFESALKLSPGALSFPESTQLHGRAAFRTLGLFKVHIQLQK